MSISAIGSGTSALSALQYLIQGSGTSATSAIPSGDKKALTSAIADIRSAFGTGTSAASMKTSVESAIDSELKTGKLNDSQATRLKSLFETALAQTQGNGTTATAPTTATDGVTSAVSGLRGVFDGLTSAVSELRTAVKSGGLYGAGGGTVGKVGSLLVNALA